MILSPFQEYTIVNSLAERSQPSRQLAIVVMVQGSNPPYVKGFGATDDMTPQIGKKNDPIKII